MEMFQKTEKEGEILYVQAFLFLSLDERESGAQWREQIDLVDWFTLSDEMYRKAKGEINGF